jgi:hypothetical protein
MFTTLNVDRTPYIILSEPESQGLECLSQAAKRISQQASRW